jgi:hypothetical protein
VARATVSALERRFAVEFAALDRGFRERRSPSVRAAAGLRRLNESLRVQLRRLEHPGIYREATLAR